MSSSLLPSLILAMKIISMISRIKTMKTAYDIFLDVQKKPSYWGEAAKSDFALLLYENMLQKNINVSDLSQRVGLTKQYISKVLGGDTNLTIESMAKILFALGLKLDVRTEELRPLD
jgi:DNA-binding Xre family transcriptional regulator